jgi:hypothetical protein
MGLNNSWEINNMKKYTNINISIQYSGQHIAYWDSTVKFKEWIKMLQVRIEIVNQKIGSVINKQVILIKLVEEYGKKESI